MFGVKAADEERKYHRCMYCTYIAYATSSAAGVWYTNKGRQAPLSPMEPMFRPPVGSRPKSPQESSFF